MKSDFIEKIEVVRQRSMGVPKKIDIDLSIVETDREYHLAGNLFYIYSAPDESSYIEIKVNETREPGIRYTVHTGLETPYYRLYITTFAGQAGTMQIIYGTEAPELLRILDNRSVTVAGVGGVLEELQGDLTPELWGWEYTVGNIDAVLILPTNVNRNACIIQAKSVNTGIVYLGFNDTVMPGRWIAELQAGMSFAVDNYRGDLYAIADAADQLVGYGEW